MEGFSLSEVFLFPGEGRLKQDTFGSTTGRPEIGTWWQALDSVCVKGSMRCCSTCNLYMQEDMWSTRWISEARAVAMHATWLCGPTCGGRGVSFHGAKPCIQKGRWHGVILHETEICS
ncbi:hypothetical protein DY000_02021817 [Brassica cretica]|uniref:Uncharacterized protein n=1 Tax=Brassica cretica TaxID=69181 RepID=A0ABQ7EHJ4_BRACR|nr:hypothetical protein DY000_02021817 [Brassica cretica]